MTRRRLSSRRLLAAKRGLVAYRGIVGCAVAVAVVVVGPGSLGMGPLRGSGPRHHAVATRPQPSHAPLAPAVQARASLLTDQLRNLAGALQTHHATKAAVSKRVRALSRSRQRALEQLLSRDPAAARRLVLSARERRTLSRVRGVQLELPVAIDGWDRVWHRDNFSHPGRNTFLDQIATSTGKMLTVHGATDAVSVKLTFARLKPTRLAVHGWRIGDQILATRVQAVHGLRELAASKSASTGSVGPIKVAVLVTNFANSTTSIDMNALRALYQGSPGQDVQSYFQEASYGKASLVPSFFGPYTLAENAQPGCGGLNTGELMQLANADVDFTQYSRLIIVGNCTGYGSTASNALPTQTPDGTVTLATIVEDANYSKLLFTQLHELSHTLGGFNDHASWFDCFPDAFTPPNSFDSGCSTFEYGDSFDVLGSGTSHLLGELDPYHKANAGWFSASQFPTVTASGTYTLAPYESPGSGIAALNIPRGTSGTELTVEYRQPIGFDSYMGSCHACNVTQGASIRLSGYWVSGSYGGSDTELIDNTPGSNANTGSLTDDAFDSALLPGKSFTDPEYGITISAVSASASGLTVNVTMPSQTCTHATPTVSSPSPSSQTGSGLSFTTSFTVTNADSAGCPAHLFRFLPGDRSNGTQYVATPDLFTLAPGASTTVSVNVTLPSTATAGTYGAAPGQIQPSTLGNVGAVLPAATYQLTAAADTTAPSAPTSLVATALGSSNVSLIWAPSTDNVGVRGYQVTRNGITFPATTATSFIDTNLSPGSTNTYSVQAFDLRGNVSTAGTVSVTTPARTDFTAPTAPVVTAAATDHTITLSWTPSLDMDGKVAAYRVSPCLLVRCTLPATATSIQFSGLTTQTRYDLTVTAVDADGYAMNSPNLTVYTAPLGASAPVKPQGFHLASGAFAGTTLAWTATPGATSYRIYRDARQLATVTGTTFADSSPGTHQYWIQAIASSGALSPTTPALWAFNPQTATSDTTPPTASISSPAAGAIVSGTVPVTVQATDNVGVWSMSFYVDGMFASSTDTSPFTWNWDTTRYSNGVHYIYAVAYDAAGNYGSQGGYTVTTANSPGGGGGTADTTPPTVAIVAPSPGASVSGSVAISATASDNVGVSRVVVAVDGTTIATDTSSPYSATWDASSAAVGTHTITATAYDAAGNSAVATVPVSVPPPPDTTPPTVSIASPAAGATLSGTVTVQASASDNVAVTQVALDVDGTTLTALTASPWTFSVDTTTLSNGAHTFTVTASDAAGNTSSAQVSVTVQNGPVDTSAPSTPGTPRALVVGTNQVAVRWTASTDNVGVVAYDVWRDGVDLGETPVPNYLDTGLTPATSHIYQVYARDAAGNRSAGSRTLSTKTSGLSTSSTGTIAGVVYDSAGKPLANVVVTLTGNGLTKSAKTNTSGVYKLSSLLPGTYTLTITRPASSTTTSATLPASSTATAVTGQTVVVVTSF